MGKQSVMVGTGKERNPQFSFDCVESRCHRRVKKDAGQGNPLDSVVERTQEGFRTVEVRVGRGLLGLHTGL